MTRAQGDTVLLVAKRAYGSGSLYSKSGCWYGRWRTPDGRRQAKKIGTIRTNSNRNGLTKKEAEAQLRELILSGNTGPAARAGHDLTVNELGRALVARLEGAGRKTSHVETVRYHLSAHIGPLLGDLPVSQVDEHDVGRLVDKMSREGKAAKTIRNVAGTLHSVLAIAVELRLVERNPCHMAKLPSVQPNSEIRFLTTEELERVVASPPSIDADRAQREWWPVVRLLVLTAAMTGMRLGELRALRWHDLDFGAMKVRVRQSFVRGNTGRRSRGGRSGRSRSPPGWSPSSRSTTGPRCGTRTAISCSPTRIRGGHSIGSGCCSTSRRRSRAQTCGRYGSTTCDTPLPPPSRPAATYRSARSRNGWGTSTRARRSCTPITCRASGSRSCSTLRSVANGWPILATLRPPMTRKPPETRHDHIDQHSTIRLQNRRFSVVAMAVWWPILLTLLPLTVVGHA